MNTDIRTRWAWGVFVLGVMLLVAAGVLGIVAVWTHGPQAGRIGGTAGILGVPGFFLTLGGSFSVFDL